MNQVDQWQFDEVDAACATYWVEGYFAWVIRNIRPIDPPVQVIAKRKLYLLELDI